MGLPFLDNCVLTINKTFLFRFVLAVAVCLLANIPQSKAQPVDTRILTLTDNYESYFLSPYVIQYNDPKHAYSAKDILTQTNLRTAITEVTGSITVIDNSGDTKWFVLDVINRSEQKTWVLDFGNNFNGINPTRNPTNSSNFRTINDPRNIEKYSPGSKSHH